jgi:hypothetical protein
MLQGNIFSCNGEISGSGRSRSSLPRHDSFSPNYDCGSDSVNAAMYVWVSMVLSLFIAAHVLVRRQKLGDGDVTKEKDVQSFNSLNSDTASVLKLYMGVCHLFVDLFRRISLLKQNSEVISTSFRPFVLLIRNTIFYIAAFTIGLLLPVYTVLSVYYSTHTYAYIWTAAIAYLEGLAPAVVLMLLLFVFYVGFVGSAITSELMKIVIGGGQQHNHHYHHNCSSISFSPEPLGVLWKAFLLFGSLLGLDVVVVLGVNIAYVYILTLNLPSMQLFFIQISISLFKIVWGNAVVLRWMSNQLYEYYAEVYRKEDGLDGKSSVDIETRITSRIIQLLSYILIFNNIVAPFLADALIDPNCFYYVVQSPDAVSVSYQQYYCVNLFFYYIPGYSEVSCDEYAEYGVTSTYIPPFMYSYQCTSTLLNGFVGVFVYRYLLSTLFGPLLHYVSQRFATAKSSICAISHFDSDTKVNHAPGREFELRTISAVAPWVGDGTLTSTKSPRLIHQRSFCRRVVASVIGDMAVLVSFGLAFPL